MFEQRIAYGAAYYDEYMPLSRVEEDMALREQAAMNIIRIAESTWSTWEPREGEFDFTSLNRVLQAARRHHIQVIVGTPTYAIPPWLARKYPDILAETHDGPGRYGHRQLMDLTHPGYRRHCEIIIRRLLEAAMPYENVVGFQLDNETKPYDTCSPRAQALFKKWLQEKFGTVEALNAAFGLAYWSNALGSWDDLPDVRGTINGSLAAEYEAFQRHLVTEFLTWQRSIVDEYRRPDQFVTHNFDYAWRDYSWGLQPDADQFDAAKAMTVAGCDIYHPSAAKLTGTELSLCGDIARGLKGGQPFLVLETQAQGPFAHFPFPGQLRLCAFAHLANGAAMVEYWHWHSIHNAKECYWKGILSHDLLPGAAYREIAAVGAELTALGPALTGFARKSPVAIIVSGRSLTGIKHDYSFTGMDYNDILRWLYDALFRLNIPCDILPDTTRDFTGYDLVAVPGLYCAQEDLIAALRRYVAGGGHLLATYRSFFCDEHVTIRHAPQPYGLTDVFGMTYDQFCDGTGVEGVEGWMELLRPDNGTEVLRGYRHWAYAPYAAATLHPFGRGQAAYLGAKLEAAALEALLETLLPRLGVPVGSVRWPLVVKSGVNGQGRQLTYLLNYGPATSYTVERPCRELRADRALVAGDSLALSPFDVAILCESRPPA